MSSLFEASQINGMTLANRFVRSATWEGMAADDGAVTPRLTQTMIDLAKGGVGLIISGHAFVQPEGQAGPWQLGIYKDELVDGLKSMTDAVHGAGGKIVAQLAHAGHFAPKALTGKPPCVASDFEGLAKSPRHELTKEDIARLVMAFAAAAGRAKTAGFDGVQIHSGHGYLLSQFLSPAYNRRSDEYGGDIGNRVHLEILAAIRQTVGTDYPVLIKINSEDCIENGLTREDSLITCKLLADAGLDAIELSGGTLASGKLSPSRSGIKTEDKEAYFQIAARMLKKEISIPLILVGGVRSISVAENLVKTGVADFLSMCRPFIREPDLVKRWKSGDLRPALCKSDNLCFGPAMEGKGIYCVVEEQEQKKSK
ncbi:MAG: NADH:flavin oxidoreductase [Desulfobacteraceae bacterium]|nr:MAG: NADH:flavin oxidoreductase [Desulfobacteraceae bacterium]